MNYLLDTDTCVFWLRGLASVRSRLTLVGPMATGISTVTLAELRYGADCSAHPEANHQAIDDFCTAITPLDVTADIARTFGNLKAHLRQQGMLIEDFDLLIAATAQTYNMTMVTNNLEHFSRIPDLHLENWVRR